MLLFNYRGINSQSAYCENDKNKADLLIFYGIKEIVTSTV